MEMEEITDKKIDKALHYKELLDRAEEAKKRGENLKFAEECGVSISSLNRLKRRYDKEGFSGLIDKRNGNPDRNKEALEIVKKKFLDTGLNGEKIRKALISDGANPNKLYTERHIYRIVAEYKKELQQVGIDADLKKTRLRVAISK
jgi:DNA-binding transcriptional MerR regulator